MREDWIEALLPDVCEIKDNLRKPINNKERSKRIQGKSIDELYPYYGATGKVGYIDDYLTDGEFVLVGEDAAPFLDYTKDVAYIIKGKTWVNNHAHILKSNFNDKYLCHYLNQFPYKDYVSGTTRLKLTQGAMKRMPVIVAPLPEQRAIVAKIEQLFSELDNGIANLSMAQEQLKVYRQAVLKKAFEGGFTTEWREKQTDYATINKRVEQLSKERQDFYKEQIEEWKKAVKEWEIGGKKTKKPSRISKPKEFAKVKLSDVEDYDSLPGNWAWSRFGSITYKVGDIDHKMPKTVPNGMPYLSTGNIGKDGKVDFENAKLISKEDFKRLALKIKPQKGDIIFPRYGTIGRNILIDFEKEFLVSYSCAIIKNITKLMDEKFILYYSLSPVIKKEIKKYTVETTQANIGIASIEMFVFPLCPLEEQHQIVQEIESRLSVCDKVEEIIAVNLQKVEALRQSILKKAFSGELLTDAEIAACKKEKDWEPARELLKRIKKEKN